MANIRKRGNKWQVQVRRAGFPTATKSFNRIEEAKAWARQREVAFDQSEAGIFKPAKESLSDLLRRYLKQVTPHKKSYASETRRINRLLRDPISKKRLCDLRPEVLAAFRDRRLKDGLRAASYDLQIIRHCVNVASSEWGVSIKSNPVNEIRMPRMPSPRERRLRPGEYELLLKHAGASRSWFLQPLIILGVETGMRLGEMLSMRWDDIDEFNRTVLLRDTKNGRNRLVPFNGRAWEVILNVPCNHARIIPVSYDAIKSAWRRLLERAGVDCLRFHDLRHEAISRWFEVGLTVSEVQLLSGHKTALTAFQYAHPKNTVNCFEKLQQL